ncbi:MAG: glycosyltransferase [Flavobacteriales bacterium]|nr:glycosyltransferase [Flavobacteriales bacterium]
MKLLIVLSRFPYPLEKGDKLRAYYQIKELSKYNEIILCCFTHSWVNKKYLKELRPYCADIKIIKLSLWKAVFNLIKTYASEVPFQVAYFYQEKAQKEFDSFVAEHLPKHIYCQLVRVAKYAEKYTMFPKTLDYMDALSMGAERRIEKAPFYLRSMLEKEANRLKKYEVQLFDLFDVKTIISEQDRELIKHPKNGEINIIRNGVKTDFFKPVPQQEIMHDIVFTGNMAYPPNIDGAVFLTKEILPLIQAQIPNIRLVIAGATPTKKVQELKSDSVVVTGWVDDIRESYASSKVFIAPMRIGTGLQNKLLEAMSMQIPCVTTPLANNALGATHKENILIGSTANELATCIIDLLKDKDLREKIAKGGHDFVQDTYDWTAFCNQLNGLIKASSSI